MTATFFDACQVLDGALGVETSLALLNSRMVNEYQAADASQILDKSDLCRMVFANFKCVINAQPKSPSGEVLRPCFDLCVQFATQCNRLSYNDARAFCQSASDNPTQTLTVAPTNQNCFGTEGASGMLSKRAIHAVMEVTGWTSKSLFLTQIGQFLSVMAAAMGNGVRTEDIRIKQMCMETDCSYFLPDDAPRRRLLINEVLLGFRVSVPPEAETAVLLTRLSSPEYKAELEAALTLSYGFQVSFTYKQHPAAAQSASPPRAGPGACGLLLPLLSLLFLVFAGR